MTVKLLRNRNRVFAVAILLAAISVASLLGAFGVHAQNGSDNFHPGNLVVSRSVYVNTNNLTAGTTVLPPDCSAANCPIPATAVTDGTYPYVFNNDTIDGSFGVTSKILLDQITPAGQCRLPRSRFPTAPKMECLRLRIKWSPVSPRSRKSR